MRDPHRLNNFYNELCSIHKTYVPQWRFGQMLSNIFHNEDIFFLEEDEMLKRIKKYFEEV